MPYVAAQFNSFYFIFSLFKSAGVGQTGEFCSLSILIERLKSEGVVDVFQTIKLFRSERLAMVQTKVRSCSTSSNTCQIKSHRKTHKCRIEQFSMTLESNYAIAIATLGHWLKNLVLVYEPMRNKTKTNRTLHARFFARFEQVTSNCWEFCLLPADVIDRSNCC